MSKKTVRSGIIGVGFSGSFHYESLSRVYGTNVDFRGVFSLNKEKREAFAAERGTKAFDSIPPASIIIF